MKKERPILFSTEMVKAILDGRKTMTRRIMKPQPEQKVMGGGAFTAMNVLGISDDPLGWTWKGTRFIPWPKFLEDHECPYGRIGDTLWVRETWAHGDRPDCPILKAGGDGWNDEVKKDIKWKPSIFMPREASRLFLEVTDIKVERLQDISDGDVHKEGVSWNEPLEIGRDKRNCKSPAQRAFRTLWDKINGEESWNENPWLWCISFIKK